MKDWNQTLLICGIIAIGILTTVHERWDLATAVITGAFALLTPRYSKQNGDING